jgi:hypothetical protein
MNINKLVRRNLSKPFAQRVSTTNILRKVQSGVARMRGNAWALLAQIHEEEKSKFDAIAEANGRLADVKRYV